MKARRYQLRKEAVAIIERGHPWLFREQMSSAAHVFADGDWLRLVDGANRDVGYGIYESEGAIAIRMLRLGAAPPDAAWFRERVLAALDRRRALAEVTDGIRLVHGESDDVPAVVVDRFADTLVVASYSAGADALARYVARVLHIGAMKSSDDIGAIKSSDDIGAIKSPNDIGEVKRPVDIGEIKPAVDDDTIRRAAIIGSARNVILRPARRRRGPELSARNLYGAPPEVARFTEHGVTYAVDVVAGHKTGTYLDLRGLRQVLAASPLTGARVLNLFAYTGMLGRAAEAAGAADITHVDASDRALAFAAAHHVGDSARHRFIEADVFTWLPALDASELFDVIIVDPPAMTSRAAQVPSVLAAYRKLYRHAAPHVRPGGLLVSACCTSRIERKVFHDIVRPILGRDFALERDIPPEPDHPVGFPQADYLKILCWRRSINPPARARGTALGGAPPAAT